MLTGGAIIVTLVVLVNWIIVPLSRKWAELGSQLEPRLALLETVRLHVERHASLLAQRDQLCRQIGSLLESEQSEDPAKKNSNTPPKPPENPAQKPEPPGTAKKDRHSFEAELAKIAEKSGAKITLVSTKQPPRPPEGLKYFKMTALRIQAQSNAQSLLKMLHAMEKGNRFIRIESLKIHQDLKKPGSLSLTMEIAAYTPADEA